MPPLDSLFYFLLVGWQGHTQWYSGITPNCTLRDHSWGSLRGTYVVGSVQNKYPTFGSILFTEYLSQHIELREWKFPFLMLVLPKSPPDN